MVATSELFSQVPLTLGPQLGQIPACLAFLMPRRLLQTNVGRRSNKQRAEDGPWLPFDECALLLLPLAGFSPFRAGLFCGFSVHLYGNVFE